MSVKSITFFTLALVMCKGTDARISSAGKGALGGALVGGVVTGVATKSPWGLAGAAGGAAVGALVGNAVERKGRTRRRRNYQNIAHQKTPSHQEAVVYQPQNTQSYRLKDAQIVEVKHHVIQKHPVFTDEGKIKEHIEAMNKAYAVAPGQEFQIDETIQALQAIPQPVEPQEELVTEV